MFEPEPDNITCPGCHKQRVYFDRQMGHYCMACGRQFSTEEVESLLWVHEEINNDEVLVGT